MTYREIAKEMGVNYQTVQRIEARALEKVKAQLEQRGYGESFTSEWVEPCGSSSLKGDTGVH